MALCKKHPDVAAAGRCTGCAEEYCANCLIEMSGQKYCGGCKTMALEGRVPSSVAAAVEAREFPSQDANKAFGSGIGGFILGGIGCFWIAGIVLGIQAIVKGLNARSAVVNDTSPMAKYKATAAVVMGVAAILLNIGNLIARLH